MSIKKIFLFLIGIFLIPNISSAYTYGSNFLTSGTPTADSVQEAGTEANKAVDSNTSTSWTSNNTGYPHWWKYDLGSGITKSAAKAIIYQYNSSGGRYDKDFQILGSNNDSSWYVITTSTFPNQTDTQITYDQFLFTPTTTPFRYYKIQIDNGYNANNYANIYEITLHECLDCNEEPTSTSTTGTSTGDNPNTFIIIPFMIFILGLGYVIIKRKIK